MTEKSWGHQDLVLVHVNDFINLYLENVSQLVHKYTKNTKAVILPTLKRNLCKWFYDISKDIDIIIFLDAVKCNLSVCSNLPIIFNIVESEISAFVEELTAIEARLARRFYIRSRVPNIGDFAYSMCFRMNRLTKLYEGKQHYSHLASLWKSKDSVNYQSRIFVLLIRYRLFLDLYCILCVPKSVYKTIKSLFSHDQVIEGFAAPFNTSEPLYCSPFENDVTEWSSLGSFFNLEWPQTENVLFLLHPPSDLYNDTVRHIENKFTGRKTPTVVVLISCKELSCKELSCKELSCKELSCSDKKVETKFLAHQFTIKKNECTFWDIMRKSWVYKNDGHTTISIYSNHKLNHDIDSIEKCIRDSWKNVA